VAAAPTAPPVEEKTRIEEKAKVEKPAVKAPERPAAKEPEKPAKAASVAAPVKPAPAIKPAGKPVETQPEPAPKSGKGLKLVLAALATTALFVMLFVYPGFVGKSSKTPATSTQQDGSPLQLRVERSNGELLLTWNRDSDVIRTASKAVLAITDGEQHENVEMDLAQLRNGSIVYAPQGTGISFKMEVTGQGQNKTTSE